MLTKTVLVLATVVASIAATAVSAAADQAAAPTTKPSELEGTWLPSAAELAGKPFPDEVRKSISLVVSGDQYTVTVGAGVDKGTLKFDPSTTPKSLDIIGTDGPNKGKTFLCIYERTGDTVKICYDLTGAARPKEFKTAEGTLLFLVTYELKK
jgi:uncharacterized protein (TIGR03067 family)